MHSCWSIFYFMLLAFWLEFIWFNLYLEKFFGKEKKEKKEPTPCSRPGGPAAEAQPPRSPWAWQRHPSPATGLLGLPVGPRPISLPLPLATGPHPSSAWPRRTPPTNGSESRFPRDWPCGRSSPSPIKRLHHPATPLLHPSRFNRALATAASSPYSFSVRVKAQAGSWQAPRSRGSFLSRFGARNHGNRELQQALRRRPWRHRSSARFRPTVGHRQRSEALPAVWSEICRSKIEDTPSGRILLKRPFTSSYWNPRSKTYSLDYVFNLRNVFLCWFI